MANTRRLLTVACAALLPLAAQAQQGTYAIKLLTPESALKAAQAALKKCRTAASRSPWRWWTAWA
jgi:hypothetical protein